MIFQPNSRLIFLLGISVLIHVFVFLLTFSKATISANTNNRALTVDFMQLPAQVEVTTLSVPRGENAVQNNADEPIALEETVAKASDLEPQPSKVNANNHFATLPLALPEPTYYAFNELDTIPTVLENIEADPPELLVYPQGGNLKIQLWMDETGGVLKDEVIESDLPAQFSENATKAFMQVKFSPGLKNNVPVRSIVKIVVHYAPLNKPV